MTVSGAEVDEDVALLELLYLCPIAIVKIDSAGAIQMMNPLGVQILMPICGGNMQNLFDIFAETAPEIREMASRYPDRAGRICDEHRIIVDIPVAAGTQSIILSLTMHKVDDEVLIAVLTDVTAAALRERLVRANEVRLHAVFDGVMDYGICTLDPAGTITSWNQSAERMEGYRADEVIGMTADLLLPARGPGRQPIAPFLEAARKEGRHEYEAWRIRKDGSRFWASSLISVLRDKSDDALIGYSIVTRDLTKHKRSEDQLRLLASTDPLTGAYNRRAFYDVAVLAEVRWRETEAASTVLMLDLDHFKDVNDRFGHDAGDQMLRHFVGIVHGELRGVDVIGRHGGEEFLVLLCDTDAPRAMIVADRIRERLAASPLTYENKTISITVSVGVAQLGVAAGDMASLIRAADGALYRAKSNGRNMVEYAGDPASAKPHPVA